MPTPFMHLNSAIRVLPELEKRGVRISSMPAYLLGQIAPDVTAVTGKPRVSTHFFSPRDPELRNLEPHTVMLDRYPALLQPRSEEQRCFVLGLLAHLKADELWMHRIAVRFFRGIAPEERHQRRLAHDAFRTRVDIEALKSNQPQTTQWLQEAVSKQWYPLEKDAPLQVWRDRLLEQMKSGQSLALEVFAERLNISAQEFSEMVFSEEWQNTHVRPLCAPPLLQAYWEETEPAMVQVMWEYWQNSQSF